MYYICLCFLLACAFILIPLHSRFLSEKRTHHVNLSLQRSLLVFLFYCRPIHRYRQLHCLILQCITWESFLWVQFPVRWNTWFSQEYALLGQQNLHVTCLSSIIFSIPPDATGPTRLVSHCVLSLFTSLHRAARKGHKQVFLKLKVGYLISIPYKNWKGTLVLN
jgi:hypothetical protein